MIEQTDTTDTPLAQAVPETFTLTQRERAEQELLRAIALCASLTAELTTGFFRAEANRVLRWLGMPDAPLNASREDIRTILLDAEIKRRHLQDEEPYKVVPEMFSQWQPIATAPKAPVGSMECWNVLAYWPGGVMEIVYWADGWWPAELDAKKPWAEPTHWMLLPLPPTEES